jgi:hypothetical protein
MSGPGLTMRVLLDDEQFAAEVRRLDGIIARKAALVTELRRLQGAKSALIDYELRRRIVEVLAHHPEGMLHTHLVAELGLERSTELFSAALYRLKHPWWGVVEVAKELHPAKNGVPMWQRVYGLTDRARGMSRRELEEALGCPAARPRRERLRVIDGGRA